MREKNKFIALLVVVALIIVSLADILSACGENSESAQGDSNANSATTVVVETTSDGGTIERDAEGNTITRDKDSKIISVTDKNGNLINVADYESEHHFSGSIPYSGSSSSSKTNDPDKGESSAGSGSSGSGSSGSNSGGTSETANTVSNPDSTEEGSIPVVIDSADSDTPTVQLPDL